MLLDHMASKPPMFAGGKPGMDATKGAAPKMPFGKGQISKKAIGGKRAIGRKR
jgi:hypothetical protein